MSADAASYCDNKWLIWPSTPKQPWIQRIKYNYNNVITNAANFSTWQSFGKEATSTGVLWKWRVPDKFSVVFWQAGEQQFVNERIVLQVLGWNLLVTTANAKNFYSQRIRSLKASVVLWWAWPRWTALGQFQYGEHFASVRCDFAAEFNRKSNWQVAVRNFVTRAK